ncbi:MAG: Cof-type HAD-IIB family hydrolase [Eubacteriales bacterium]|nr:Cof-type HAD-IIB family hydrolase [Eubacteriales bacterium]
MLKDIRVIVSDFDGTLLDDEKRLPEQFPALLDALEQRGIRFIAASGRQYYNIRAQLPDGMADRVDYIAENGAMTVRNNEICWVDEMPMSDVAAIVHTVRSTKGCYAILCGAQCAYFENGNVAELVHHANMYYARLQLVQDILEAAATDRICKIAVFHNHDAEHVSYPALLPFADHMQVALSGDCWVDVMNPSVSKGTALTELLRQMQISPERCMAFGDYLNDIQLLQASGHPYVMENAHPQLLELFDCTGGHNNHAGVLKTICRELGIVL